VHGVDAAGANTVAGLAATADLVDFGITQAAAAITFAAQGLADLTAVGAQVFTGLVNAAAAGPETVPLAASRFVALSVDTGAVDTVDA
jgi:hypothetical protein